MLSELPSMCALFGSWFLAQQSPGNLSCLNRRHGTPRAVAAGQADVAAALRQLRGMRASVPGREEAVTHLLIGATRRTLKVLPVLL